MADLIRYGPIIVFLVVLLSGCSGSGSTSNPVLTGISPDDSGPELTNSYDRTSTDGNQHSLWLYNLISVDASNLEQPEFEIIPIHQAAIHLNILNWLENGPCTDCLKITNITHSGYGTLLVDVELSHPFDNPNFTGFDVRGIVMFDGSHIYPETGMVVSDRSVGDGALVNSDGYTSLYNPGTIGHNMEGYLQGNLATTEFPSATLNGYKRHVSDDPSNTRNAFLAGDSVTVTYEIDMPDTQFVFGYAVDASWAPPISTPVTDPMTDFGLNANCPEAWQVSVSIEPVGDGYTDCGGSAMFTIDFYDWQGPDYTNPIAIECPELFDGTINAAWDSEGDGFIRFTEEIENLKLAEPGEYLCLVGKSAQENDPIGKWWLDLTGYQLITLNVIEYIDHEPTAVADVNTHSTFLNYPVTFDGSGSHDNDCDGNEIVLWEWDWESDGVYDEIGEVVEHSWDIEGLHLVQLRVTDDEGSTDELDEPLEITISGINPFDPKDVTHDRVNLAIDSVTVDGDYAYFINEMGSLQIYDLTDPENPEYTNGIELGKKLSTLEIIDGYAYVANSWQGLQIVDVDPPESTHLVTTVETPPGAVDVAVAGDYAYVPVYNDSYDQDLFIIRINPLETAEVVHQVPLTRKLEHVEVDGNYAYVAASHNPMVAEYNGLLHIIDITEPESAFLITTWYDINEPRGMVAEDGYIYLSEYDLIFTWEGWVPACYFTVLDVDPPQSVNEISSIYTTWIPEDTCKSGDYAYVIYNDGKLRTVDVSDPADAQSINTIDIPRKPISIDTGSGYAYFTSPEGLGVVDIDPTGSEFIVNILPTCVGARYVAISGDYACVLTYLSNTVKIVDMTDPVEAYILNTVPVNGWTSDIEVSGGYAFVLDEGLSILDIDPPETASVVATYPVTGSFLTVSGGYAYIVAADFTILDIDPPESPNLVTAIPLEYWGRCIDVNDNYACMVTSDYYLTLYDISDPSSPFLHVSEYIFPSSYYDIMVDNEYAYIARPGGLQIYGITQPGDISVLKSIPIGGEHRGLAKPGDYIYVTKSVYNSPGALVIIDAATVEDAFIFDEIELTGAPNAVAVDDNIACVAGVSTGLRIVQLW